MSHTVHQLGYEPKATSVRKVAAAAFTLLCVLVLAGSLRPGDAVSIGIWGGIVSYHAHQVFRERHPFGRKVALRAQISGYLMLLNPLALLQNILIVVGGVVAGCRRAVRGGRDTVEFRCRFPFQGEWYVLNGGVTRHDSHSWNIASQRYAYDFIRPPVPEERDNESMSAPDDYAAFGSPVLSPATGTVVSAEDGTSDSKLVGDRSGWVWPWFRDLRGNHVVIEHDSGTGAKVYSLLAHLKKGSVAVAKGQRVHAGDVVGACGNSGQSTEPHLHFHVQDRAGLYWSLGVPIRFVVSEEQRASEGVVLSRGQLVSTGRVAR